MTLFRPQHRAKAKPQPLHSIVKSIVSKFQQRTKREPRAPREGLTQHAKGVNMTFKDPIYKILEFIKKEPYFRWLDKMG